MSRVHDALRRAEQVDVTPSPPSEPQPHISATQAAVATYAPSALGIGPDLLSRVRIVAFAPAPETHVIDVSRPGEPPAEEFRTLRTRLNHLQNQEAIHSIVISSPSPAEGKSFAAVNLAIAESQLEGNNTLLIDCDFRRPIMHNLLQIDRAPGMTDFLQGKAELHECIRKVDGLNLYILPAGEAVVNPLELLNRVEMKLMLQELPRVFNWIMLDSPPMLFAADANLLSTLCNGTILVVRIGSTTVDSVTRAMQAFSENNVLGIIANGARRGELYSKYTYYHSYNYSEAEVEAEPGRRTKIIVSGRSRPLSWRAG